MSDQPIPPQGANGAANPATGPVVLNLQFTKDLSFEVPGAPEIYLNLREAALSDVQLIGCRIGTLDLAGARTSRTALTDCRVEDLDLRNRKGEHLDLRGLDVVRLNRLDGADGLSGATITDEQAHWLGPLLARALRIVIAEEEP